jgi:hypothetical protein
MKIELHLDNILHEHKIKAIASRLEMKIKT